MEARTKSSSSTTNTVGAAAGVIHECETGNIIAQPPRGAQFGCTYPDSVPGCCSPNLLAKWHQLCHAGVPPFASIDDIRMALDERMPVPPGGTGDNAK